MPSRSPEVDHGKLEKTKLLFFIEPDDRMVLTIWHNDVNDKQISRWRWWRHMSWHNHIESRISCLSCLHWTLQLCTIDNQLITIICRNTWESFKSVQSVKKESEVDPIHTIWTLSLFVTMLSENGRNKRTCLSQNRDLYNQIRCYCRASPRMQTLHSCTFPWQQWWLYISTLVHDSNAFGNTDNMYWGDRFVQSIEHMTWSKVTCFAAHACLINRNILCSTQACFAATSC